MENKAYEATHRAAFEIATTVGDGIIYEIAQGDITDGDALSDALHSAVDSALTYTVSQWVCAWGLPDSDEGLSDGAKDFDSALVLKAYENLMGAVQERFAARFAEALQVAADKGEEESPVRVSQTELIEGYKKHLNKGQS